MSLIDALSSHFFSCVGFRVLLDLDYWSLVKTNEKKWVRARAAQFSSDFLGNKADTFGDQTE